MAREAANRFFRLGIPAESHVDGYVQRMLASTFSEGDVIFAVSASGVPAELVESVEIARSYGARTISLTKPDTPLALASDFSLGVHTPESQDVYKPSALRLVHLAIIDVLAAGTARERPERVKELLRCIRTSLTPAFRESGPKPIGD